jgi:hypothetical protein
MSLIDSFHQHVELLHLVGIQYLANAVARFFADSPELRLVLLSQIPHLLRGLIENPADLLDLSVGEVERWCQRPVDQPK